MIHFRIEDEPIKDKEIEKIIYIGYGEDENMQYELASKLNEVIDVVNKLNKEVDKNENSN